MKITEKIKDKSRNLIGNSPIVIGFLGDSVTHGCFELYKTKNNAIETEFRPSKAYHHVLAQMIETVFPSCAVGIIDSGISGDSAPSGAERCFRDIIERHPDLCVVCYGLNDACCGFDGIERYREGLASVFGQLRDNDIETIFMTPNMMCTYPSNELLDADFKAVAQNVSAVQNNGIMDAYMEAAIQTAERFNVKVCDCYAKWKKLYENGADITRLLSNRINHPTEQMHYLFAESLFEIIMEF